MSTKYFFDSVFYILRERGTWGFFWGRDFELWFWGRGGGAEILLWGSCLSHTSLKLTAAGFQVSGHN